MNSRKRHLLVDTEGLLLKVKVHEAGMHDSAGAKVVLEGLNGGFPRMKKLWADYAYRGLKEWVRSVLGWELEIVRAHPQRSNRKGFSVQARRWVVERTFAWLIRNRRLMKDYEYLPETEEAFVYAAMVRLMLRRLANQT